LKARTAILCLLCLVILVAGARVFYWTNMPKWKARDSRIKWKQTLPDAPSSALALGRDGTLYVATRGGVVYALAPSGAVRWAYRADLYEIPSGLLLDRDENLYFFTLKKSRFFVVDWNKAVETACSPEKTFRPVQAAALGEGAVYATCGENFVALNTADGRDLWRLPLFEDEPKPVVLRNGAVVSSRQWRLEAVDANGNPLWNFPPSNYEPQPKRPGLVVDQPFFLLRSQSAQTRACMRVRALASFRPSARRVRASGPMTLDAARDQLRRISCDCGGWHGDCGFERSHRLCIFAGWRIALERSGG